MTNNDPELFVSRKRESEVYWHSSEIEIIQCDEDKMDFFLAFCLGAALCIVSRRESRSHWAYRPLDFLTVVLWRRSYSGK